MGVADMVVAGMAESLPVRAGGMALASRYVSKWAAVAPGQGIRD